MLNHLDGLVDDNNNKTSGTCTTNKKYVNKQFYSLFKIHKYYHGRFLSSPLVYKVRVGEIQFRTEARGFEGILTCLEQYWPNCQLELRETEIKRNNEVDLSRRIDGSFSFELFGAVQNTVF